MRGMDVTFIGTGECKGLRFVGTFTGTSFPWTIERRIEPADRGGAAGFRRVAGIGGTTLERRFGGIPVLGRTARGHGGRVPLAGRRPTGGLEPGG